MSRFAVEKETDLITIYNIIHPCPDSIWEDASLDGNDQGVPYSLYDAINNDSDFEDTKKTDSSSDYEEEDENEQDQPHGIEKKSDKFSNDLYLCLGHAQ